MRTRRTLLNDRRVGPGIRGHVRDRSAAFSLLELMIAVALFAGFVVPLLEIKMESRVRAFRYSEKRRVKALAQAKLYDRINDFDYEGQAEGSGTFEAEGRPNWTWTVYEPELRNDQEVIILEYTIQVEVPLDLESDDKQLKRVHEPNVYEFSVWTFPNQLWLEQQQELYDSGQESLLYGDPLMDVGGPLGGDTGSIAR